ncbi:MAG TPA: FtsQ-type POTRA domain-containing protein [Patescibacteria group bacterium]|nr:FtsQ-type POTRA domain-containing protein [Patescibacteria group bacterium]
MNIIIMGRKQYRKLHRYKKRKPVYKNRGLWLGFLILAFSFSLFYFLFLSEFFQIKEVKLAGCRQISQEQLNLLINEKLEKKILFFPSQSIFLADLNAIKKDILERFPGAAKVEIKRIFPETLDFSIIEREGVAVFYWADKYFVLDKEGVIFEEKSSASSVWSQIKVLDFTGEIRLGAKVLEKSDLAAILQIDSELKEDLNILVEEFVISAGKKLTVSTVKGWEIYFNLQENVEWQLTKLKAVLEEKIPPEKKGDLEYIELRFGNFANPKYKD